MGITEAFYDPEELSLTETFFTDGHVVKEVDDREALDAMRDHIVGIVCDKLNCERPNDPETFLNTIHERLPVADLNDVRLHTYRTMNDAPWFRATYFKLARQTIRALVGNELAMQNKVNLSIQYPRDDSSLLGIHCDVFGGETPFQVVCWIPLVDCFKTKSMYILPPEPNQKALRGMATIEEGGMQTLYEDVKQDLRFLDVPYGTALVFSPNLLHGNTVNEETETRWSMNCRFTGLFTPYKGQEKKLGAFYLPITARPVTRIGMNYRYPEGFEQ